MQFEEPPIRTLGSELPKEIERCAKLLAVYESLGPVGAFGKAMIQADLDRAQKAISSGDLVGMVKAYSALRGCK